ncbi:hypothetical protein LIER_35914 [Lithospermum erythrorhizon]|uniref:Uncharacterized protein n=1 Tax=Lithospermum erythrorhizon TaxID=34254 RepID=A0AAV3NY59_LITER
MLRPSILGVLGTQPSSIFNHFSYHQIKETEVAYALSLRFKEASRCDDEVARLKAALSSTEKERDEALSKRDELADLCQRQRLEHALLRGFNDKVGTMEIEIEDLKKALGIASHFTTFVTALGEDYVVSLFDELPEEEPAESEEDSDSGSGEDEADGES